MSEEKKKKTTKDGWMNGRKARGVQGGGKGRNSNTELCRGGYLDPEAIWLSCSVRLLAELCPELQLTLFLCLSLPFSLSFCRKATTCKYTPTHYVYLTAKGQIHTCV